MSAERDANERVRYLEARLQILSGSIRAFAEAASDYEHLLQVVAQKLAEVVKDGCVGCSGTAVGCMPRPSIFRSTTRSRTRRRGRSCTRTSVLRTT